MQSYVPGAIWSKIMAGDADWIIKHNEAHAPASPRPRAAPPAVESMQHVAGRTAVVRGAARPGAALVGG